MKIELPENVVASLVFLAVVVGAAAFVRFRRVAIAGSALPWPVSFWAWVLNRLSTARSALPNTRPHICLVCDDETRTLFTSIAQKLESTEIDLDCMCMEPLDDTAEEEILLRNLAGAEGVYFVLTSVTEAYLPGLRAWATANSAKPVLIVAGRDRSRVVPEFIVVPEKRAVADFWKLFAQATLRGSLWTERSKSYHRVALVALLGLAVLSPLLLGKWQENLRLSARSKYNPLFEESFPPAFRAVAVHIRNQTDNSDAVTAATERFLGVTRQDCVVRRGLQTSQTSVSIWRSNAPDSVSMIASSRPSSPFSFGKNSLIATAIANHCILHYSRFSRKGEDAAWDAAGNVIGSSTILENDVHAIDLSIAGNHQICKLEPSNKPAPDEMICVGVDDATLGLTFSVYGLHHSALGDDVFGILRRALIVVNEAYSCVQYPIAKKAAGPVGPSSLETVPKRNG